MEKEHTPNSINDLLSAMADGELDLREYPEALAKIAQDPQAAQRIACQQQLRQACAKAMDRPGMTCPDDLAAKLRAMGVEDASTAARATQARSLGTADAAGSGSNNAAYAGPPVLARLGRWVPAAVAAVLLIAAAVVYTAANPGGGLNGLTGQQASFLSVDQIDRFTGRHGDCSLNTDLLYGSEKFGGATAFNQLPGKLADYFQTSTDGLRLSLDGIGYQYEIAGACTLPGKGSVHIVYKHKDHPDKAISLWVKPADQTHAGLKEGQVYANAGDDLMHPVIYWRQGGLLYYLVGDSIEDANKAVKALRQTA